MIGGLESWPETLIRMKTLLAQRYGIEHVTLQPEIGGQTLAQQLSRQRNLSAKTLQRNAPRKDEIDEKKSV
jgi:hypothetical protein